MYPIDSLIKLGIWLRCSNDITDFGVRLLDINKLNYDAKFTNNWLVDNKYQYCSGSIYLLVFNLIYRKAYYSSIGTHDVLKNIYILDEDGYQFSAITKPCLHGSDYSDYKSLHNISGTNYGLQKNARYKMGLAYLLPEDTNVNLSIKLDFPNIEEHS